MNWWPFFFCSVLFAMTCRWWNITWPKLFRFLLQFLTKSSNDLALSSWRLRHLINVHDSPESLEGWSGTATSPVDVGRGQMCGKHIMGASSMFIPILSARFKHLAVGDWGKRVTTKGTATKRGWVENSHIGIWSVNQWWFGGLSTNSRRLITNIDRVHTFIQPVYTQIHLVKQHMKCGLWLRCWAQAHWYTINEQQVNIRPAPFIDNWPIVVRVSDIAISTDHSATYQIQVLVLHFSHPSRALHSKIGSMTTHACNWCLSGQNWPRSHIPSLGHWVPSEHPALSKWQPALKIRIRFGTIHQLFQR